jgi:hypothetical protein
MSPAELQIVDRETCRSCKTSDCIKGNDTQRGCELGLFLPMKVGNLDCTLCLDCVHACPHDNIALATRTPGAELLERGRRSGIGRLMQRADLAALALVFTCAALVSAFAMTTPAYAVEQRIATSLGARSEGPVLAIIFIAGLLVLPVVLLGTAGLLTRGLTSSRTSLRETVLPYAHALIPIGLGVWVAHYGFHLLTGVLTIVPVVQSAVVDAFGRALLGGPLWGWVGLQPGTVFPIQLGCVVLGTAGSLGLVLAISQRDQPARPVLASAPWLAVVLLVATTALWILSQPMEMRAVNFLG